MNVRDGGPTSAERRAMKYLKMRNAATSSGLAGETEKTPYVARRRPPQEREVIMEMLPYFPGRSYQSVSSEIGKCGIWRFLCRYHQLFI